jgi:4-hydroxybenzoate polyprenyltransferase
MSGIHFADGLWAFVFVVASIGGYRYGCHLIDLLDRERDADM